VESRARLKHFTLTRAGPGRICRDRSGAAAPAAGDDGPARGRARDYAPDAGRWTLKDPIAFRGNYSNLYEYVDNSPLLAYDPSGRQRLFFDGSTSTLFDDQDRQVGNWPAASGAPRSTPADQNRENYGPIPEGFYYVDPEQIDRFHWSDPRDYDWYGAANRRAWGNWRVPIKGFPGRGRKGGYFIHGGGVPGSIGCIDVSKYEDLFFQTFKGYTEPIPLRVDYPGYP